MENDTNAGPFTVLIAEDDPDDRVLLEDAFHEVQLDARMLFVENGEALLCYLRREAEYGDRSAYPDPDLILLDLNMPRKNGREALAEIKGDERLRRIPTVVLTTSRSEEDISSSYAVGANSYIVKPTSFRELVDMAQVIRHYWLEMVDLPLARQAAPSNAGHADSAGTNAVGLSAERQRGKQGRSQ